MNSKKVCGKQRFDIESILFFIEVFFWCIWVFGLKIHIISVVGEELRGYLDFLARSFFVIHH